MPTITALNPSRGEDIEIVTLTPALAEQWLALNHNNRNKKPAAITRYARDMASGNWRFTGEPIKFDSDGYLIDGQNRCYAVIESGRSIDVLVVRNLERTAQDVMDTGAVRRAMDALHMNHFDNAKDLAAVIAVHSMWAAGSFEHCMTTTRYAMRPTHAETVKYAREHPELANAIPLVTGAKRELGMPIGALVTAYVETARVDGDDCAEFFSRIEELHTNGKGDPISTLLKRSRDMRDRRERVWPATSLFMLFRAWNAFRAEERLVKFQFGSEGRWSTIPEPK